MKHWIKLLGVISVLMICLLSCNKQNVNKIKEQNTVNEDNNKITESVEKSKITIMSEKQNRADLCTRIYDSWKASTKFADYSLEKEELPEGKDPLTYISSMESDFEKVTKYLQMDPVQKVTIYLVDYDIRDGSEVDNSYGIDNTIVTNLKGVESGEYLASIISTAYGIEPLWIAYGLAGAINESLINADHLTTYYNGDQDFAVLGLADYRFFSICDGKEIKIAKETTISLFNYMSSTYGQDFWQDILEGTSNLDMTQVKNDWLQQIKVQKKYENQYELAFEGYRAYKDKKYDLHIVAPYADFYIKMNLNDEKCYLTCVENLEKFLYKNKIAVAQLKDYICEQNLDDLFNINRHLFYYIGEKTKDSETGGVTDQATLDIHLYEPTIEFSHMHETSHAFTLNLNAKKDRECDFWIMEGIACYLPTVIDGKYSYYESDSTGNQEIDRHYAFTLNILKNGGSKLTDYYLSHGGKLDHPQQFDRALFMDAFSACLLDNAKRSDYEDVLYELKESWMNYMVDKFGIRKISEVVSNPSEFESIIGETFEETREDWKKRIID